MDLHSMASGLVSTVNPMIDVVIQRCTGYTTNDAGVSTPTYASPETVSAQVQSLGDAALQQMEDLNIGGVLRQIFVTGTLQSVDRSTGVGGDLVTFGGNDWLVVHVLGQWPDWVKAVLQKQVA